MVFDTGDFYGFDPFVVGALLVSLICLGAAIKFPPMHMSGGPLRFSIFIVGTLVVSSFIVGTTVVSIHVLGVPL